jgi:ADP-ribose pyrophosphatase
MQDSTRHVKSTLHKGQFLELIRCGHWEYVKRVNTTGAAVIIAVTDDAKLVLVEQYRIPCEARTIELPAGIIGDEPHASLETHIEAARRELIEETGFDASHIEELSAGPASSGLASEIVTLFLATGLQRVGQGGGVAHEEIMVHEVPVAGAREWLADKARTGLLVDPKVFAGLYFAAGVQAKDGR